jgi:hypothetical protein
MPIHQFWGTHLTMGQYAWNQRQPFKTEKDYTNFLKKNGYVSGLISAMVYMKRNRKREQLPKALTGEDDSALADMPTTTIEDNLFYSSIK